MTINKLIDRLQEYRARFGGDAEVRLMMQAQCPFENNAAGVVSGEEINAIADSDDDDVGNDRVVYIVEGDQLCYGSRRAWELAR